MLEGPDSASTAGVCYRISEQDAAKVLEGLDFREKGGYTRAVIQVARPDDPTVTVRALLYTANPANPNFYEAPLEEAARIITSAVGPSGPNLEYFDRLAEWLTSVGEEDAHIDAISALIRRSSR
mmetsp:Transcript_60867/g.135623  ORF Transcript_60867/g.135623 Transcript_60867/m.135623 type:complete len:124 (-) Transcript_60867:245-616(-)